MFENAFISPYPISLSTYILCSCKRNHRESTTALNAFSRVKNTLIHHGIDVVEKTSRKEKRTHAQYELAGALRSRKPQHKSGHAPHKDRCRDAAVGLLLYNRLLALSQI